MSQQIDQLIHCRWVATVNPENTLLENHSLAVNNGLIIDILEQHKSNEKYQARSTVELDQHLVTPGLVNAHGHAAMTLFRGMADDYPLMTWLEQYIWPAEGQFVDESFVHDGTRLAIAEMISGGTTCFSDMYFFPGEAARAAQEAGIRAQIVFPIFDMPSAWGQDAEDYLHKGLAVFDDYRHSELIRIGFGPHAPYTISDEPLQRIATLAAELDAPVQIHLHETAFEVETSIKNYGMRPVERMKQLGILGPNCQAVHMVSLNQQDMELVKESGTHIIHCPESNMKLASGFAPTPEILQHNINLALGTDGAASNNDLDILSEARSAALLAKALSGDATALPATTALRMLTINGAKALGIDSSTGSLETGKQADIAAFDLGRLCYQPVYNPVSQLIYTDASNSCTDVWVAGKRLLENGQLTTMNPAEISLRANHWKDTIKKRN